MPDLHARLLAEIERREDIQRMNMMPPVIQRPIEIRDLTAEAQRMTHADEVLAYLGALRKVAERADAWTHEVVDDCWYTCAAATDERDGGETCDDARRGGDCDCGLEARRTQVLAAVATALGVGTNE